MVAGTVSQIIRVGGKLVIGATDLTAADPFGGTEVGLVMAFAATPLGVSRRIECEGTGAASDVLQPNNRWVINCIMRGWDDNAVELLLKGNRAEGAKTQHDVVTFPGARTPGQSTIDYSNVLLLFVPDNIDEANALVAYRAIPLWDDDAEIPFSKTQEFVLPLVFDLLANSSGNTHQIGRLADLSLT